MKTQLLKLMAQNYTSEHFFRTIPKISFQNIPEKKEGVGKRICLEKTCTIRFNRKGFIRFG